MYLIKASFYSPKSMRRLLMAQFSHFVLSTTITWAMMNVCSCLNYFLLNRVSDFRARTYSHIQWVSPEQNRSIMCPGGYVAVGIKTDVRRTPCCGFGYHVGPLTNNVHMALCCKNEWKGHHSFCGGAFCPFHPHVPLFTHVGKSFVSLYSCTP